VGVGRCWDRCILSWPQVDEGPSTPGRLGSRPSDYSGPICDFADGLDRVPGKAYQGAGGFSSPGKCYEGPLVEPFEDARKLNSYAVEVADALARRWIEIAPAFDAFHVR